MIRFWNEFPFLRYTLFLAAGVLLYIELGPLIDKATALLLTSIFFLLTLLFRFAISPRTFYEKSYWLIVFVFPFFSLLGFLRTAQVDEFHDPRHFQNFEFEAYLATVIEPDVYTKKSIKTVLEVQGIWTGDSLRPAVGQLIHYRPQSMDSLKLIYGDQVMIKGQPQALSEPANPGEFNYKRFLSFSQIYHQQFTRDPILLVGHKPSNALIAQAYLWREKLTQLLKTNIHREQSYQIAKALILGQKDELQDEVSAAYAAAGAMHVLAVSGLHVGIVYGIFWLVLKRFQRKRWVRYASAALLVLILWAFALLTGLSPSVMRAATMFSAIIIAQAIARKTNIYNVLSISAFILIMANPYILVSVGFQLSYLAVVGIVYLQPLIKKWWMPPNRLIGYFWELTAVSLAAQIATAPVSMHYFHQFPVYFLVSNLIVIPAAGLILYGGVLMILFQGVPLITTAVGWCIDTTIWLVNVVVFWVESLPMSLLTDIYLSITNTYFLYFFIIFFILFWQRKRFNWLIACALSLFILIGQRAYELWRYNEREKLVIYHVNGATALDHFNEGKLSTWLSDELLLDRDRQVFHIRPNRIRHGMNGVNLSNSLLPISEGLFRVGDRFVGMISDLPSTVPENPVPVDILIIQDRGLDDLSDLLPYFEVNTLIFDGTNPSWYVDQLLAEDGEYPFEVISVHESGAIALTF